MDSLKFLQSWYKSYCDGDWEHHNGITIQTLDNPGWAVVVDLTDTKKENLSVQRFEEQDDNNWMSIITKDKQLIASGDPDKLEVLLLEVEKILRDI